MTHSVMFYMGVCQTCNLTNHTLVHYCTQAQAVQVRPYSSSACLYMTEEDHTSGSSVFAAFCYCGEQGQMLCTLLELFPEVELYYLK